MKPDPCPLCGANRNLVGFRHNCVPKQAAKPAIEPVADKSNVDNGIGKVTRVDNAPCETVVINIARVGTARTNAERQAKWRAANRDKHRERNRNLMRHRRAEEKAATAA